MQFFFKKILQYLFSPQSSIINHVQFLYTNYVKEKLRLSLMACGEDVTFRIPLCIEGSDKVKIGHGVTIGTFVHIWGQGGVEIGDYTLIASHVAITSLTHSTTAPVFSENIVSKPVIIGNNVWIGSHSVILPGVEIGDGAIIGAGAVVNKNVPPNSVFVGVPAKFLKNRFEDTAQ